MCLGVPGRVVESADLARQTIVVEVRGERQQISAAMLLGDGRLSPQPGAWVLVHMGFAAELMDEAEALSTLESMDELKSMYDEFALSDASADAVSPVHSSL